jgi:hypothetical protein
MFEKAATVIIVVVATVAANAQENRAGEKIHLICKEVVKSKWLADPNHLDLPLDTEFHFIDIYLNSVKRDGNTVIKFGKATVDNDPNFKVTQTPASYDIEEDVPPNTNHRAITVDRRNRFLDWTKWEIQGTNVRASSHVLGVCDTATAKF